MTSTAVYKGDLRTELTHIESGSTIFTDAPKDNHGKGEAFSPTDLVATALGSCMLSTMGIYARQHQIDMEGARVDIIKEMASNPRRIAKINALVVMPAKPFSEKDRTALEHAAESCPVAHTLHPDVIQDIKFLWHE